MGGWRSPDLSATASSGTGGTEDMLEHPKHLTYTPRHLWAEIDDTKGVATIGVTEDLVEMMADIVSIDMPLVGDELDMDTFCIHLHLPTRIQHLRSPLSGRVTEINRDVLDNAGLLALSPYTNWLYRMEFDEPGELEVLMSAAQYGKYLDRL
jgi:glycine cleavage system H protein